MNSNKINPVTTCNRDLVPKTLNGQRQVHEVYRESDLLRYVTTKGFRTAIEQYEEQSVPEKSLGSERVAESSVRKVVRAMRRFEALDGITVLKDQRIIAWSKCGEMTIWNFETGESWYTLKQPFQDKMSTLAVLDESKIVVASICGRVSILLLATGEYIVGPRGHTKAIRALTVLQDGKLVSVGEDGVAKIWNTRKMLCERTLGEKNAAPIINAVALEGNRVLLHDSAQKIKIFCVQEGQYLNSVSRDERFTSNLVALEGGRFVSGELDGKVKIWDGSTGRCVRSFVVDTVFPICRVASCSPGKLLVVTGSGAVKIIDIKTRNDLRECGTPPCKLRNVLALSDERVVLQLENGEVLIRKL